MHLNTHVGVLSVPTYDNVTSPAVGAPVQYPGYRSVKEECILS